MDVEELFFNIMKDSALLSVLQAITFLMLMIVNNSLINMQKYLYEVHLLNDIISFIIYKHFLKLLQNNFINKSVSIFKNCYNWYDFMYVLKDHNTNLYHFIDLQHSKSNLFNFFFVSTIIIYQIPLKIFYYFRFKYSMHHFMDIYKSYMLSMCKLDQLLSMGIIN